MKLVAIITVWHDYELLYYQIRHLIKNKLVDHILVIYSEYSNYGEYSEVVRHHGAEYIKFEPSAKLPAMTNETDKRNFGLRAAIAQGHTHFIMMDADEFYDAEKFHSERDRFVTDKDLRGLVCASMVYFKTPTLTIGLDTTLVPFIHKLAPYLRHGINMQYPFAFENKNIRIDPTRQLNIHSGVKWSNIIMDHYSWVRRDIEIKIRNSTARNNIERSTIRKDFEVAKEGEMCKFYNKRLLRVANKYDLPIYNGDTPSNIQLNQTDNTQL